MDNEITTHFVYFEEGVGYMRACDNYVGDFNGPYLHFKSITCKKCKETKIFKEKFKEHFINNRFDILDL
jgi:hypothetical protein